MKAVLMSIRADICRTIFHRWTKRLEYRTRFNADFRGTVYVYESGRNARQKIIGSFEIGRIIKAAPYIEITDDVWRLLNDFSGEQLNKFFAFRNCANPHIYCLEITNVKRYTHAFKISDFCEFFAKQKAERPPQSWQYIEMKEGEAEPAFESVKLEEVVKIVEDEGEQQQGELNEPTPEDSSNIATN